MKNKDFVYSHPNTVWETIKNQLEIDIITNVYKVGERVPSVNDLARQYNVSANTASKALEYLRDEEIIMKKSGIGFFVLPYAKTRIINCLKEDFGEKLYETLRLAKILGYSKEEVSDTILTIWGGVKTSLNLPHREDEPP